MVFDFPRPDLGKLLGSYECEIHGALNELIRVGFKRIINVGAGDGYYAVGLARLLPEVTVEAFELLEIKHALIRRLASINEVTGRIRIRGACDVAQLQDALAEAGPTLVLMDVEGAEQHLLDMTRVRELARCWILVELHDRYAPGVTAEIEARFRRSHRLQRFATRERNRADFPLRGVGLDLLSEEALRQLMTEQRPGPQEWFCLSPYG